MEAPIDPTLISNWTVALIQGVAAALRSAEQGGIIGELPFSDLILALDTRRVPNAQTENNIFYGKDTHWARMILKSFQSRQLRFSYVLFSDKTHDRCDHGCLMAEDPLEQKRFNAHRKLMQLGCRHTTSSTTFTSGSAPDSTVNGYPATQHVSTNSHTAGLSKANQSVKEDPCTIEPYEPKPSLRAMSYGLTSVVIDSNDHAFTILHRRGCILKSIISEEVMGDDISKTLREKLSGKTYEKAMDICYGLLLAMCKQAKKCTHKDPSDHVFIRQLTALMENARDEELLQEYASLWTSIITTFSTRVPGLLSCMDIKNIYVEKGSETEAYPAKDIPGAFFIYFGIQRACKLSKRFYQEGKPALIFSGNHIHRGHDVVRDLTEIPSLVPKNGFTSSLASDNGSRPCKRVRELYLGSAHFFRVAFLLEAVTSVAIMLLTFIGPILSMYGARQWASSYRESYMQSGTSMRWAVSKVALYAGKSPDDFAVYISPKRYRNWSILGFILLTLFSSAICIVIYPFSHPQLAFPFATFSRVICIVSCVIGILWVIVSQNIFTRAEDEDLKEAKVFTELKELDTLKKELDTLKKQLKLAQLKQDLKTLKDQKQELKQELKQLKILEVLATKQKKIKEELKKLENIKKTKKVKLKLLEGLKEKKLKALELDIKDLNTTLQQQGINITTNDKKPAHSKKKLIHTAINILLVLLLLILVEANVEKDWLYLYVLEAVYGCQWLYGELMDEWVFESTAFFMLGVLSALRLTSIVDK